MMIWARTSFGIFFSVLIMIAVPAITVAQTCEDLFSASAVQAVVQVPGKLLAPTTIAGRAVKDRIVRGLLSKSSAMRAKGRASTSISASGVGFSSDGGKSSSAVSTREAAQEPVSNLPIIRKQTFQVPYRYLSGAIRWLSDQTVIALDNQPADDDLSIDFAGAGYNATLVNVQTGERHNDVVLVRHTFSDLRNEPFLIARDRDSLHQAFSYRFLDKETLQEIRPALQDVSNIRVSGNFISYQHRGQFYLTSLRPQDFGAKEVQPVVREIDAKGTHHSYFGALAIQNVWDQQALRVSIKDDFGKRLFDYNQFENVYRETVRALSHTFDMSDARGKRYTIEEGQMNGRWKIRTQGEKGVQEVALSERSSIGETPEILHIFGDGTEKSLIVEGVDYHLVKFGFHSNTVSNDKTVFRLLTKYGDRFVLLDEFVDLHQVYANTPVAPMGLYPILVVDLATGRTYNLAATHHAKTAPGLTALLDPKRYINVDVELDINSSNWKQSTRKSTVRVHDLETGRLERQLEIEGDVQLIKGTRLLSVGFKGNVRFVDLETEEVVWGGPSKSNPRVSPDGSRVAYEDDGKLSVMILGDRLESRRTF